MILGVFFHAALAYSPLLHNVWLTADNQQSMVLDIIIWFTHLFRMPIFFLIAGFFAFYLIEKRGLKGMVKNRSIRILVPFLIFLPLLMVAMIMAIGNALETVENKSPMLQFITLMSQNPDTPKPPISTMHLWFLYNLMYFYGLAALLYKTKAVASVKRWMINSPLFFLIGFPLLMVPALVTKAIPHPSPESFYPELWSFGFYGLFFLLGFFLYRNDEFLDRILVYWWQMLLVGIGAYALFYSLLPETFTLEETIASQGKVEITWAHGLGALLEAYSASFMTLGLLLAGRKYFNLESKISRYIADASYWIYLIHLPLLFFIQFKLLDVDWNLWIKFMVSSLGTMAIGLITYMIMVRWTPIGSLLNGKKKPILS